MPERLVSDDDYLLAAEAKVMGHLEAKYLLLRRAPALACAAGLLLAGGFAGWLAVHDAARKALEGVGAQRTLNEAKADAEYIRKAREEVQARAGFTNWSRLSNNAAPFTAPSDGFVYIECPDGVKSCRVLIEADQVMTSGLVKENDSAMFPVARGQAVTVKSIDPPNGDAQVRFFPR